MPFIKVIDEKGKLIAKGRDLAELKARCRVETHRPVKQQKASLKLSLKTLPLKLHKGDRCCC